MDGFHLDEINHIGFLIVLDEHTVFKVWIEQENLRGFRNEAIRFGTSIKINYSERYTRLCFMYQISHFFTVWDKKIGKILFYLTCLAWFQNGKGAKKAVEIMPENLRKQI